MPIPMSTSNTLSSQVCQGLRARARAATWQATQMPHTLLHWRLLLSCLTRGVVKSQSDALAVVVADVVVIARYIGYRCCCCWHKVSK